VAGHIAAPEIPLEERGTPLGRLKELQREALNGKCDFSAVAALYAKRDELGAPESERLAQWLYELGHRAGFAVSQEARGKAEAARAGFEKLLAQSRADGAQEAAREYWGEVISHLVGQTGGGLSQETVLEYAKVYEAAFAAKDFESRMCVEMLDAHPDIEAARKLVWLNRALGSAGSDEQRAKVVEAAFTAGVHKEQPEQFRALARAALEKAGEPAAKARIEKAAGLASKAGTR
jgi:hypothetical protein